MSQMADPMLALLDCQLALDKGLDLHFTDLGNNYKIRFDKFDDGERYFLAKIANKAVLAIAIFGLAEPIDGQPAYSVGCAVKETHRGQGLAIEAMNLGIEEIKKEFRTLQLKRFYIEGVIDQSNQKSLRMTSKLISEPGLPMRDQESQTLALFFKKLIEV